MVLGDEEWESDEDVSWYGPISNSCPNSIQVYGNSGTVTNNVAD